MEGRNSLYEKLLSHLECPVCINYMGPSIRLCETGHSVCEPCMKKLRMCPLCQKLFIKAKNISLQALALIVRYPCTNESLGCGAKIKLERRANHEKICPFRGFKCAVENCTWTGILANVKSHWKSKGKSICYSYNHFHTNMKKGDSYCVNLARAYKQFFWIKCKLQKGRIYWAVQLIGDEDQAYNYRYEIDICKSKTSKRRITLKDYCKSIEIDNNDLFSKTVCITTISADYLSHFINKNQLLSYYIHIHKR